MRSTLVADTSVLYGALDRRDKAHPACVETLSSAGAVAIPVPAIVETALLAERRLGVPTMARFLASVVDDSVLVVDLDREDYARVLELVVRYDDLPLSVVDASVVAIAERLEHDTIATLDRRHLSVVKPLHIEAFTLVP